MIEYVEELKQLINKSLYGNTNRDNSSQMYDLEGYCGAKLFNQIVEFWDDFTVDNFIYFVSGEWYTDELDLDGGREYFITGKYFDEIVKVSFKIIVLILDWREYHFNQIVYNSWDLSYEINNLYESDYYEELLTISKRDKNIKKITE